MLHLPAAGIPVDFPDISPQCCKAKHRFYSHQPLTSFAIHPVSLFSDILNEVLRPGVRLPGWLPSFFGQSWQQPEVLQDVLLEVPIIGWRISEPLHKWITLVTNGSDLIMTWVKVASAITVH